MKYSDEDIAIAEARMGRRPINPIGQCFDSAAQAIVHQNHPSGFVLCHGIGISNFPGQEGMKIRHAWCELPSEGVAYDTTWGKWIPIDHYRKLLQLNYVVTYTRTKTIKLWKKQGYSGPWDAKIREVGN